MKSLQQALRRYYKHQGDILAVFDQVEGVWVVDALYSAGWCWLMDSEMSCPTLERYD